jgi:hypothetical protein
MRRQHVIIGGDNADIMRFSAAYGGFFIAAGGKSMRQIAVFEALTAKGASVAFCETCTSKS